MAFLDYVLQPPTYGWKDGQDLLIKPTSRQIFSEFFSRLNIFKTRKNWLPFVSWVKVGILSSFFIFFLIYFLSWWTLLIAFVYGMIIMGTHGTIWHHRYCTHNAFTFRNAFWRFITQNLTISVIPEEIYVISHHVHHCKSDQPGDPYNAKAGFLYCFLADVNHQPIAKDLNEVDYYKVRQLMRHTGIYANTYSQYKQWGSYANPLRSVIATLVNWSFWYITFYLIGGHSLAFCLFGAAGFWAVGVRTFNYDGHGKGKGKPHATRDFNHKDDSINQLWPGFVAGEWHNNHHLYPKSARSGFKPYQIDFAWYYIFLMNRIGAVSYYKDSKKDFYLQYYLPYLKEKNMHKPLSRLGRVNYKKRFQKDIGTSDK